MEDGRNGSEGKCTSRKLKVTRIKQKGNPKYICYSANYSNVNVSYNNSDTLGEIHKCRFKNLWVKFSP